MSRPSSEPPSADTADGSGEGRIAAVKGEAVGRWQALQNKHAWLRHVLAAWTLMQRNNANQYAAAITYFSFLALFPLILLGVSVLGFVLSSHRALLQSLLNDIQKSAPGSLGTTLKTSLQDAIDLRTSVGIIGLAGVLLTGLGWIGNLRAAINAVWGRLQVKQNFLRSRAANLLVLGGLGIGVIVSLGLTAVGTSLTDQLLRLLHITSLPGATYLLKVLGIAVAVAGDMIIFWWLLIRLPQAEPSKKTAFRGALLAAVGFEILKIVGTYTIAKSSTNATLGPFAGAIAILVWIQLVARWVLFCCAWLATAVSAERTANTVPIIEPEVMAQARAAQDNPVSPAAVGATLVGAGAVAGAVAGWYVRRDRPASKSRTT